MLKRLLAAAILMATLMLSAGADRLLAECYMVCEMWVRPGHTITICGDVWCDGEGG